MGLEFLKVVPHRTFLATVCHVRAACLLNHSLFLCFKMAAIAWL